MASKYDTEDYELEFMVTFKRITPMKDCPMCYGQGTTTDDYHRHTFNSTCNECDGTGKTYIRTAAEQPIIPEALVNVLNDAWEEHNNPKKVCPKCDGYGEWDDADFGDIRCNTFTCDKCEGTGKIALDLRKESTCECCKGTGYDGQYMCDCCKGTGVEPKMFKCRECEGSGQMDDPATRFETKTECTVCDGTGEI